MLAEAVALGGDGGELFFERHRVRSIARAHEEFCGTENFDLLFLVGELCDEFVVLRPEDADIFAKRIEVGAAGRGSRLGIVGNVVALDGAKRDLARFFQIHIFRNAFSVEEGVVRRTEVPEDIVTVHGDQLGVRTGYGSVVDLDRVLSPSSYGNAAATECETQVALFRMFD